ncbi:hypothetical protein L596_015882 [Steinernema carpocapsae]|uniref:Uncharacterized protein n=1 Tax=Steinernema carpocapsae TaxID=34508 RepID=A0A4U5NGA6_STECR|nr:hypothetical protein L596_015882 [Steinernema carpocapsae]
MPSYEEVVDFIERVQELERHLGVPPEGDEVRGDEVDVIGIKKMMQERGLGFVLRAPIEKLKQLEEAIYSTENTLNTESKLALIEMQSNMMAKWCDHLKEVAVVQDRVLDRKAFEVSEEQKQQLEQISKQMEQAKLKAQSRRQDVSEFQKELVALLTVLNKRVMKLESDLNASCRKKNSEDCIILIDIY